VFSRHHRQVRVFFALADILLVALAFEAAYQARLRLSFTESFERLFDIPVPIHVLLLGFSGLVWVGLGFWFDVYQKIDDETSPAVVIRETSRQTALGFIAVVLFQYFLRLDLSRPFIAGFALFAWVFICLFRLNSAGLMRFVRREFSGPHEIMVVGTGVRALRLAQLIEESEHDGARLRGFIADTDHPDQTSIQLNESYPVHPLSDLSRLLAKQVIDEVVFAVDSDKLASLEDAFLYCDEDGVRTRVAIDFFPHVNSKMYLDRLGEAPLLTFSATPHDEIRLLVKRATDFCIAFAGLLLLAPFMALTALIIRVTSPGPAIFRQERCGLNGRRFTFYKFRSMCDNAEELRASLEERNEKKTVFKIQNDPRLTKVGRWLRKFSVDELPQLWNVLRGDMSLVGPRPPLPDEVRLYERWQRRRLRMRPGLTCLWAISGRDSVDFETWMKMDMQYIDQWSLALDWKILVRTIPRVLMGKGAS
jgi:exopolysaccharide biosynthesis polyprenyl glycosylphosphotransferase